MNDLQGLNNFKTTFCASVVTKVVDSICRLPPDLLAEAVSFSFRTHAFSNATSKMFFTNLMWCILARNIAIFYFNLNFIKRAFLYTIYQFSALCSCCGAHL